MQELIALLPEGPARIALALGLASFYVAPKLQSMWRDYRGGRSLLENKKMVLETLRLRYEVEALRREHGIENLATQKEQALLEQEFGGAATAEPATGSRWGEALWGTLGSGVFVALITLFAMTDDEEDFATATEVWEWALACVFFAMLGGVAAIIVPGKGPLRDFLAGLLLPLALAVIIGLLIA